MEKIKILHCGDVHLDTPFREFDSKVAEENRADIKRVLRNIIDICNEEEIEILLIAGDFFDNNTVKKETLDFIRNIFKCLDDTKVFISPGNHDPFYEKSFYTLVDWPENVYIFKGKLERVDLEKVSIHGFGFNNKYENEGLLKEVDINKEKINILVGHGDINDKESEYNPISKEDIYNSELDYIALGHIHKFSGIKKIGKTYYAYSGCLQGRGFDEDGDKGILIGSVGKEYIDLQFRKTSIKNFETIEIRVDEVKNSFEVEELILNSVINKENGFFKIILSGEVEDKYILNIENIQENIKVRFNFVKVIDKIKLKIPESEVKENSVKGLFIKYIQELNLDEEISNIALKIGLKSLREEEVSLDDY
ncbi:MAG: metallophosphoesterase family protein [Clostridium sp.]